MWHGSATSRESVDLAAKWGDPLFSANVTNPIDPSAELIRYYRQRWEFYKHDPAAAIVGASTAGFSTARTSQEALEVYRPIFEGRLALQRSPGLDAVSPTLEDFVERSSALIGSPQQIIDKVHHYHERFGHQVLNLRADGDGRPRSSTAKPSNCSNARSPRSRGATSPAQPGGPDGFSRRESRR